jgi:hypothetical protein
MLRIRVVVFGLALATAASMALADDKWESSLNFSDDDTTATPNQLTHGAIQTHDLQGTSSGTIPTDRDFSFVASKVNHSYEVNVFSSQTCFNAPTQNCATLDRVDSSGTVITVGIEPDPRNHSSAGRLAVRWTSTADKLDYVRVNGYLNGADCDANNQYDIQMRDTTYLIPRWNDSATQTTSFVIQNGTSVTVNGNIFFYDAGGALLLNHPIVVAPRGVLVLNTATLPGLPGAAGSVAITHDGSYGALSGKAVALEPATGFTFDTAMLPIPY